MHIAEGMLSGWQIALTSALAAGPVWLGARALRATWERGEPGPRAAVSLSAALLFALTAFPLPLPWLGVSSHLCAAPMLGILLGVWPATFLAALVLGIEALFLGHGGLTTLGANTLTLGLIGASVARAAWWGMGRVTSPLWAAGLACGLGHVATYAAAVGIAALALNPQAPAAMAARIGLLIAPMQLPLVVVEGIISALILRALARRSASLVPGWCRDALAMGVVVALLCAPAAASAGEAGAFEAAMAGAVGEPAPVEEGAGSLALIAGMFAAGVAVGRASATLERQG
jgi:cobalt/nickel transport system permease protein